VVREDRGAALKRERVGLPLGERLLDGKRERAPVGA
jgi:hypothetical protein